MSFKLYRVKELVGKEFVICETEKGYRNIKGKICECIDLHISDHIDNDKYRYRIKSRGKYVGSQVYSLKSDRSIRACVVTREEHPEEYI